MGEYPLGIKQAYPCITEVYIAMYNTVYII